MHDTLLHSTTRPATGRPGVRRAVVAVLPLLALGMVGADQVATMARATTADAPAAKVRLMAEVLRPASRTPAASRVDLRLAATDAVSAGLSPDVLDLALGASRCAIASGAVSRPGTLTVIDYSRPSAEERLWVFDLSSGALLHRELVAHGQGTGDDLATRFSNEPDSHQTSLGLFVTDAPYVGKHGYSLRLRGLEPGVNDRAWERAIVIHGAEYVSRAAIASLGRLGRSWGCPAIRQPVAREMIDTIKDGGLVFSYYPDPEWLAGSRFLGACASAAQTAD